MSLSFNFVNFVSFVVNIIYIMTEATLVEQPEIKELEYRVIAINKAGESQPSNTVMVVL